MYKISLTTFSIAALSAALCLSTLSSSAFAQRKPMTMADIQALEKSESWRELAGGLGDIPPASRNATWEKITVNTALNLLSSASKSKLPGETFNMAENILEQFPQLGKNKEFMAKRGEVGVLALKDCYRQNSWWAEGCYRELVRFSERDPSNDNMQFALGKLVRLNGRHANATPYFEKALAKSATPARCDDSDVSLAVVSAMFLPDSSDIFKTQIKAAQLISEKYCTSAMKPVLLKEAANSNSYYKTNACGTLKAIASGEESTKTVCN